MMRRLTTIILSVCLVFGALLAAGAANTETAWAESSDTAAGTQADSSGDAVATEANDTTAALDDATATISDDAAAAGPDNTAAITEDTIAAGPDGTVAAAQGEGCISGFLWVDGNGSLPTDWNGLYDSGERPLAGYTVSLYAAGDRATPVATTRTDKEGAYLFEGIAPGNYVIGLASDTVSGTEYLLPMAVTAQNKFAVDWNTDPLMAFSSAIELGAGMAAVDINAGMRLPMGIVPIAAGPFTYTDTIDLSARSDSVTGTGYVISGGPAYAYIPNFLMTTAAGGLTGNLAFNTGANGKVYHIIQTGVPNPGVASSLGPQYGTSMIMSISVPTGVNVTLVVTGIDLIGSISLAGTANVNLIVDGTNYVRTSISVPSSGALTIDSLSESDTEGRLIMPSTTNSTSNSAVIGGAANNGGGAITINGGSIQITARSSGAGIGGGGATATGSAAGGGTITINGGAVSVAQYGSSTGFSGAGIGGGGAAANGFVGGNGGTITINNGTVSVTQYGNDTSFGGAGIGGGAGSDSSTGAGAAGGDGGAININGGTVTVTQQTRGAGIGGGTYGAAGNITITGGNINVNATGTSSGAAIGTGTGTNPGTGSVTISGGTVSAVSYMTGIGRVHGPAADPFFTITITGGTVYAKGTLGPGIGYWAYSYGNPITITGGDVIGESVSSTGIGGSTDDLVDLHLDASANVRAYSGGTKPAIKVRGNSGDGYYVNASLDNVVSSTAATTLRVYSTAGVPLLKTLTLPANYTCFAYSSDLTVARTDNIWALNGKTLLGNIVRTNDRSPNIYSVISLGGYNANNSNAGNGVLPVTLNRTNFPPLPQDRYLVYQDSAPTVLIDSYHWLADAVNACGVYAANGAYTIVATVDDEDITDGSAISVTIPADKSVTLASNADGPYTLTQPNAARHLQVQGSLTLANIILDGAGQSGGVETNSMAAALTMKDGAVIRNCTAVNSSTAGNGGGVNVNGGAFTMNGGTISGNLANPNGIGQGGGVCVTNGTFTMSGGKVTGNTSSAAAGDGGGVWVSASAYFYMNAPAEISGNKAPNGSGGGIYTANYDYHDPTADAATVYANIGIAASATVSGNISAATRIPPTNASDFTGRSPNPFNGMLLDNDNVNYNNTDYRIIYKANGGAGADYPQSSSAASTFTAITQETAGFAGPAGMPVLKDWNTKVDGSGTAYAPGANITVADTTILYARWGPALTTLTVSKKVEGEYADETIDFDFTVTFLNKDGTPAGGSYPTDGGGTIITGDKESDPLVLQADAENGEASFSLKDGESITILDVPVSCSVQIVESKDANYTADFTDDGSETPGLHIVSHDTGQLTLSEGPRTIAFTNTRSEVVVSGIKLSHPEATVVPILLALLLALIVLVVTSVFRRKHIRINRRHDSIPKSTLSGVVAAQWKR